MEDRQLCRRFFCEPQQTLQRHYEILRAYFVDEQSMQHIAQVHGLSYYTVRDLVRRFHDQCQSDNVPPFSSSRASADPVAMGVAMTHVLIRLPWLTAESWI